MLKSKLTKYARNYFIINHGVFDNVGRDPREDGLSNMQSIAHTLEHEATPGAKRLLFGAMLTGLKRPHGVKPRAKKIAIIDKAKFLRTRG